MKWLVTAFDPFDRASTNSSLIAARALEKLDWQGLICFHFPIPVTFADAWPSVFTALSDDVDGILALGQAETRTRIGLERVALNFQDARIADNAGATPRETKVSAKGPDMYWTTIPWQKFSPLPANCEMSYSAGTFVCNTLMFHIVDWARKNGKHGGFVHLPLLESQMDFSTATTRQKDSEIIDSLAHLLRFLKSI